jgi:hypothetical protein
MHEVDHVVIALASRQHGLATRRQILDAGGSDQLIAQRCAMGWWRRVERGVYRIGAAPPTWEAKVLATCMASGGIASHRTAGVLLGVDGFRPGPVEISVCRPKRFRRPGVRVHQSTDLDLATIRTCRGIPTTDAARLLVDIGAVLPLDRVEAVADDLLLRGLTTWPSALEALLRHARRGRDGVGKLRALLDERYGEESIPLSRWSRIVVRILTDAGLPEPELEHRIYDGARFVAQVDAAWPEPMVVLELDSKKHHLNARSFERDAARRNELEILGWRVLNLTWSAMIDRPGEICRQVDRALSLAHAPHPKLRH